MRPDLMWMATTLWLLIHAWVMMSSQNYSDSVESIVMNSALSKARCPVLSRARGRVMDVDTLVLSPCRFFLNAMPVHPVSVVTLTRDCCAVSVILHILLPVVWRCNLHKALCENTANLCTTGARRYRHTAILKKVPRKLFGPVYIAYSQYLPVVIMNNPG